MALFAHKNIWYFDTSATNHFCNTFNTFTNYINFTILQIIENIGGFIMFLGKGIVYLNIQLTNQSIMPINLYDIYYVPFSIANLVSGSSLFRKSFYFHNGKCTFNCIFNNPKIAYELIINRLFALQVTYFSFITLFSWDFIFT